jgi:hypothetical protein
MLWPSPPSKSLVGRFWIVQPGSLVATLLTTGEMHQKQVGLLKIRGQQFQLWPLTLPCLRGFAVGNLNLGKRARKHRGMLNVEDPQYTHKTKPQFTATNLTT